MKAFSPIMIWVVLALGAVCALPFALSWYQIHQSKSRLVDQVQRSHLLAARTAADRLDAALASTEEVLAILGNLEEVYIDPWSDQARELITSAVQADHSLLAITVTSGETHDLVFRAQVPDFDAGIATAQPPRSEAGTTIARLGNRTYTIVTKESLRPNLWLTAYVEDRALAALLAPDELGSASEVFLADKTRNEMVVGNIDLLPQVLLDITRPVQVRSGAQIVNWPDIGEAISAFAEVGATDYLVVSRQPVSHAESLSRELRETANRVFAGVSGIVLIITMLAFYKIVRPIRRVVSQQRAIIGGAPGVKSGNEIEALNSAFEAMKDLVDEREMLSEIFIDRYQVLRRIGAGGMGSVYLGWDPKLQRHVALKTLNYVKLSDNKRDRALERLRDEAVIAAHLAHRNLVNVFDIVESDAVVIIAMELVDGESLSQILKRRGTLPVKMVLPIVVAMLRALSAAHAQGMVHRDVKPPNVLIDINGDIKLADFGTVAPTAIGEAGRASVSGTAGYIAPESILAGQFSPKSDVFAVAVVFLECLLGQAPFRGRTFQQTLSRTTSLDIDFDQPELASLDDNMKAILQAMLEKDPAIRPDADESLQRILSAWSRPVEWRNDWLNIKSILHNEQVNVSKKITQSRVHTLDLRAGRSG